MSNELEITLPLDVAYIILPPNDVRLDDEDLYKEYVEVRDGSGYVPESGKMLELLNVAHQGESSDKSSDNRYTYVNPINGLVVFVFVHNSLIIHGISHQIVFGYFDLYFLL